MKLPRPRFTVRRMLLLVAILALGLFVAEEFRDGVPPRYVVRAIPARIHRLRPEMTWQEANAILGLETSWVWGGLDFPSYLGHGNWEHLGASYVMSWPSYGTGRSRSHAIITLWFRTDKFEAGNWRANPSTRLLRAAFSRDGRLVAEMPGRR